MEHQLYVNVEGRMRLSPGQTGASNTKTALQLGAIFGLMIVGILAQVASTTRDTSLPIPLRAHEMEGVAIPTLTRHDEVGHVIPIAEPPTVLYIFSTTCEYCDRQRSHVKSLLEQLDIENVVTGSPEPASYTKTYWGPKPTSLREPLQLDNRVLSELRVIGVPMLLLADSSGVIRRAYRGMFLGWDIAKLRTEIFEAVGPR